MNAPVHGSTGLTPLVIEFGLTLIAASLALFFPRTGARLARRVEAVLLRVARNRPLAILVSGALPCVLRLILLSIFPIPEPWIQDDFSFLLASDTFSSGRLTNPTHPMWTHFESFHITQIPTYMSMYFPAQGMMLAAGKLVAGHPWFGVWASCGILCAVLCWAFQGWLPPGWALLGGLLAGLRLALFSYWMSSYTGGAVAATGGALVLGALPRIKKNLRTRDFFLMALGSAILLNSRPYEGLLVFVPAAGAVGWSLLNRRDLPVRGLVRRLLPAALLLTGTIVFMGYYNHRLFGSALTLPYKANRETYAAAQHFLWQAAKPEPFYRHIVMRNFYMGSRPGAEMDWFVRERQSIAGFLSVGMDKLVGALIFYFNFALLLPLIALPRALRDRRIRFLTIGALFLFAGMAVETWFMPHYIAPATAMIYLILLQCMRHLRARGASGLFLVRAIPVVCVLLAILRIFPQQLNIKLPTGPQQMQSWYGSEQIGLERAAVASALEKRRGLQLVIVRYPEDHLYPEWVYNAADIDRAKVVWAREMDPQSNRELLRYFANRNAWLVEPDRNPSEILPYRGWNAAGPETAAVSNGARQTDR